MREIKFRCWDKVSKTWVYFIFDELGPYPKKELENTIGIGSPIWHQIVKEKRIDFKTWGQYTNLKDKNGVEIYEGDIIYFEEPDFESEMLKCEVVFFKGCFCAKWRNGWIPVWDFIEKEPEIIGNIYSNPELIKNK